MRPVAPGPLTTSVISNDLCILGTQVTIITKGALQVDGELQADLHGIEIVIGKNGRVEGTVVGQKVSIEGEVVGVVRGLDVELKDTAKVDGEIYHQTLAIAAGSYFEGKARRPKDSQELMPILDRAAHEAKRTAA
jgi:cytoskeletal protein CcmA (bactofilin family)